MPCGWSREKPTRVLPPKASSVVTENARIPPLRWEDCVSSILCWYKPTDTCWRRCNLSGCIVVGLVVSRYIGSLKRRKLRRRSSAVFGVIVHASDWSCDQLRMIKPNLRPVSTVSTITRDEIDIICRGGRYFAVTKVLSILRIEDRY